MNITVTEISAVLTRWMLLAGDPALPLPVRKTLLVVVQDLTNALQLELPHDLPVIELPQEQPSGEHT